MNDISNVKKEIDLWIENIKNNDLIKELNDEDISKDFSIKYSPYHFSHREGNKLFLNHVDKKIYKQIHNFSFFNASLLEQLKTGDYVEMFLHKLSKKNEYKILGLTSSEAKKFKNRQKLKDMNLPSNNHENKRKNANNNVFFTNDVWSISSENEHKPIDLDEYQKKAINMVLKNEISAISGFAGTGKSLTIQEISYQLENLNWNISRIAPTGRAAQIIKGKTIHSWLEPIIIEKPGGKIEILGFSKNQINEKECVIVDEASMINDEIWDEIMRIWDNSQNLKNKKIVFVGDPGQLEPIGHGKPFMNFLSQVDSIKTELINIHRSKNGSGILDMSKFVREKGYLDTWKEYPNIKFITKKEAIEMVAKNSDIQMITPRRNMSEGSLDLNIKIKELMNINDKPDFYSMIWNDSLKKYENHSPIHLNDKIIIVKNMWEWNITNGTTGIYLGKIKRRLFNHVKKSSSQIRNCYKFINPETKKEFYLPINKKTRSQIELAYAITIHKAQGSEYKTPILYFSRRWIESKMLYTAITRAKDFLYIYYPEKKSKEILTNFIF
ncbi:MAG: AAA family ATPase [Mycoplasmatales bacterium]|nr:AAA family ATPase [Mycoplasmatales bacterium]